MTPQGAPPRHAPATCSNSRRYAEVARSGQGHRRHAGTLASVLTTSPARPSSVTAPPGKQGPGLQRLSSHPSHLRAGR